MTGFGQATAEAVGRRFTAEARSVNHKYLDIKTRLPFALQALEGRVEAPVEQALDGLMAMRKTEGTHLQADLAERCAALKSLCDALAQAAPLAVKQNQERMAARVAELLNGVQTDPVRMTQELAILAE